MSLILDVSQMRLEPGGARSFVWPVPLERFNGIQAPLLLSFAELIRDARRNGTAGADELLTCVHVFLREVLSVYQYQVITHCASLEGLTMGDLPSSFRIWAALAAGRQPERHPVLDALKNTHRSRTLADVLKKPIKFARKSAALANGDARLTGMPEPMEKPPAKVIRTRPLSRDILQSEIVTTRRDSGLDIISLHAASINERVTLGRYKFWFSIVGTEKAARRGSGAFDWLRRETMDRVAGIFASSGIELDRTGRQYLEGFLREGMGIIACHLARLRRRKRRLPARLWTGSCGNLWDRMLRIAVQHHGGHITGHSHAGGGYAWLLPEEFTNELMLADRYVTQSEAMASRIRRNVGTSPATTVFDDAVPEVVGAPVRGPRQASCRIGWDSISGLKVMFMVRYTSADLSFMSGWMHDVQFVDWMARLCGMLRTMGAEVRLKPHPDSVAKLPEHTERNLGVRIVHTPFEDNLVEPDVYLFDSPLSSTFKIALATGKPVVLVDFGIVDHDGPSFQALESRCAVVHGWLDEYNRAQADEAELAEALLRAAALAKNAGFYDDYLR